MGAPYWAMGGEDNKDRSTLQQWLWDMEKAGVIVPPSVSRTKQTIVAFIKREARAYWDDVRSSKSADAREAMISAGAINEWLASLPPVPLHGEDAA